MDSTRPLDARENDRQEVKRREETATIVFLWFALQSSYFRTSIPLGCRATKYRGTYTVLSDNICSGGK